MDIGPILMIIFLTFVIEIVTIIFRFGFHLRSANFKKYYANISKIRIHHLYFGLAALIVFLLLGFGIRDFVVQVSIAIALSDVIHHSLLKIVTGSFDFV